MTSEGRVCLRVADVKRYGVPYFSARSLHSMSEPLITSLMQLIETWTASKTICYDTIRYDKRA